jgi:ADP-ribose pyrophosphatase YjhB (NUDIX family)
MDIIATIQDKDFGLEFIATTQLKEREASRAVVVDQDGTIALLHVVKKHFHKLPGGGIEEGENKIDTLRRELSEEIGCAVDNIRELGIVEEFRNKFSLHQLSYCFLADLSGEKGLPHLEKDEIEDGFKAVWMSLAEAIATMEKESFVEDYEGKFIQRRDLVLLKLAAQKAEKIV